MNFSASCRIRGSAAEVIRPKFGFPSVPPGLEKFTSLNRLKNSARNCTLARSVMLVSLIRLRSVVKARGQNRISLPEFP